MRAVHRDSASRPLERKDQRGRDGSVLFPFVAPTARRMLWVFASVSVPCVSVPWAHMYSTASCAFFRFPSLPQHLNPKTLALNPKPLVQRRAARSIVSWRCIWTSSARCKNAFTMQGTKTGCSSGSSKARATFAHAAFKARTACPRTAWLASQSPSGATA